jgi:uncharacterized protein (DUF2267 family)
MTYRELIKKVQQYSGFSDSESEQSLKLVVETLSTRLAPDEREDFASQLPAELQDVALTTNEADTYSLEEMYEQLAEIEGVNESRIETQVKAVWRALKDAISGGEIAQIRNQLPKDLAAELR